MKGCSYLGAKFNIDLSLLERCWDIESNIQCGIVFPTAFSNCCLTWICFPDAGMLLTFGWGLYGQVTKS